MKVFEGIIVSNGMNKTAVVEVYRRISHPLYKKLIKKSKKYKVDNNGFEDIVVGSVVRITETKPISKDKYFRISEIVGLRNIKNEKSKVEEENLDLVKKRPVRKSSSLKSRKENPSSRKASKGK